MPRIHLIETEGYITPVATFPDGRESGYWVIAESTAEALDGGEIYFHRHQSEPSFYGGQITGHRTVDAGEYQGRIIFEFRYDRACRGVSAGTDGWGREKKIVLE